MSEPFRAPSPLAKSSARSNSGETAGSPAIRGVTRSKIVGVGARDGMAQRTAAPPGEVSERSEQVAIPRGGSFSGLLAFSGNASVLGELRGNIRANGKLRIGPDARVDACIEVDEVVIEGLVRGDVIARSRVELAPSAIVEGAIYAPRIQLRDGCRFTGRCQSGELAETLDLPA